MQQIYDMLLADAVKGEVFVTGVSRDPVLHRILGKMNVIQQGLKSLEDKLSTASDRLSNDVNALKNEIVSLQGAQTTLLTAITNANQRFTADLKTLTDLVEQLRNNAGSGNEEVLNQLADQIESSTASIQQTTQQLSGAAAIEDAADPAPATPPALTVSPSTVTLAPGGTQQFTASEPVDWAVNPSLGGSITPDGLYTTSSTGTSDTVTATAKDGSGRSASVSVSIVS
jgi:outer membrane murein-binding lipoprotein Lpp